MSIQAGVVTFPGSNCDDDVVYAMRDVAGFGVKSLWHKDSPSLADFQLLVLPGGFSYGDYLRCGAMAAVSPIMERVKEFAANGGMVLGICNGFQILCEVGLVPGALVFNQKQSFLCQDVVVQVESPESPWTLGLKKGDKLTWPIAHGEGRYVVDPTEYEKMAANGQIILKYKENPNGSMNDVAGVTNEKKNVFGLMPHPERATDLRSRDGMKLWKSIQTAVEGAMK